MGFFDMFNKSSKDELDSINHNKKNESGKFYKVVNIIAILGIFIVAGAIILAVFGLFPFNLVTMGIMGTITSITIGCWVMMPWVACFEQNKYKKRAIVFISLDAGIALFWIVVMFIMIIGNASQKLDGVGMLKLVQIAILVTLQFFIVTTVANTILRYGKRLLIVQIIGYISIVYLDVYFSILLIGMKITEENGLQLASYATEIILNPLVLALAVIAFAFASTAFAIIYRGYKKQRSLGMTSQEMADSACGERTISEIADENNKSAKKEESAEEQLQKLQSLLDKKLISQKEYDEKRKRIIDNL